MNSEWRDSFLEKNSQIETCPGDVALITDSFERLCNNIDEKCLKLGEKLDEFDRKAEERHREVMAMLNQLLKMREELDSHAVQKLAGLVQ